MKGAKEPIKIPFGLFSVI